MLDVTKRATQLYVWYSFKKGTITLNFQVAQCKPTKRKKGCKRRKEGTGEKCCITLTDVDDDGAVIGGVDQTTSGRAEKECVTCELTLLNWDAASRDQVGGEEGLGDSRGSKMRD